MSDDLTLELACSALRDLQRDHREEPFFRELFSDRGAGFLASSSAVRVDLMSEVSIAHVTFAWDGLCELLEIPHDIEADDLEDLLDASPTYPG